MRNAIFALVHLALTALLIGELAAAPPVPDQTTSKYAVPDQVKPMAVPDQVNVPMKTYAPDQVIQKTTYARCFWICPDPAALQTAERIRDIQRRGCIGPVRRIVLRCLKRKLGDLIEPSLPPLPIGP